MTYPSYRRIVEIARYHARHMMGTVLYVTLFGSRLYGTSTAESDVDVKVIFLPFSEPPSDQTKLTGKYSHSFRVFYDKDFTYLDPDNHDDDAVHCEIEFWTLQEWLTRLVRRGDTGGVDVLFSRFNTEAILYNSMLLEEIFFHPLQCFNPSDSRAFLGYAVGQARTYGIKGIRLNVLLSIKDLMESLEFDEKSRLEEFIDVIMTECHHDMYCRLSEDKHLGHRVLEVLGRKQQGSIHMTVFRDRVNRTISQYGSRARKAALTQGKDWKALSHAYRVIQEFIELLTTGNVTFPLPSSTRDVMVSIRNGELSLSYVKDLISQGLERGDNLRSHTSVFGEYNKDFVHSQILEIYNVVGKQSEQVY